MWRRYVSMVAVVGALAGVSEAQAATAKKVKPVCDLVTDPKGDSALIVLAGDNSSDVVSADIASNSTTLTAAVRVVGLNPNDSQAPLGESYDFFFTVPGKTTLYFLAARLYPTGNHFVFGHQTPDVLLGPAGVKDLIPDADATGVVDTAHNEVRISVPLATAEKTTGPLAKGAKLASLEASSYRAAGQGVVPSQNVGPVRVPIGGLNEQTDDATSKNTYAMGTPSCVPVGK